MATGTNGIATEGEAKSKLGYSGSVDTNKCCTKARAVAMGADSSKLTSYKDNQLVKYSDVDLPGLDPNTAPNGVYICDNKSRLWKKSDWDTSNNDNASGVAVKTYNCAFVIAPVEQTSIQWGGYGTLINGCTTTTNSDTAKTDYKGKQNTDAIIAQLGVYAAMASSLEMNEIISNATAQSLSMPNTLPINDEVISDEQYQLLMNKQQSGETLTETEIQQINIYRNNQIKVQFKEKYNIQSDVVLDLVISEIRLQFKAMINAQQEIMTLPELETSTTFPINSNDVDNISDEGIMLLASSSSEQYAANYCRNYTFKNGKQGYQPALGELYEAYQNKSEVDACMSLIGGKPLYDGSISNYRKWSSTQYDSNSAWILGWNDGNIYYYFKDHSYYYDCARPFAAFQ